MKQFEFRKAELEGVIIADLFKASDDRGYLLKTYACEAFSTAGINMVPAEEAVIRSRKGVLRGMHFQECPPQGKLISCIEGLIWTAILDIDTDSRSFGKWISCELCTGSAVYIPGTYAVGTLALEDTLFHISYETPFAPEHSGGIRWDDKDAAVNWPEMPDIIIAEKDRALQSLSEYARKKEKAGDIRS